MPTENPDRSPPAGGLPPDSLLRYSWILDGVMSVGAAPRSYSGLLPLGFSAAVNLQEATEDGPVHGKVPEDFDVAWIPVQDGVFGGVPTLEQVTSAAQQLHRLIDSGRVVYVHCFAGVGRSPMACMAYLATHGGMSFDDAVEHVREAHAPADPTAAQLEVVARYVGEFSGS